jgi:hypothetical protein
MINPIDSNLSVFFRDPREALPELGTLGVLYLLRRDVMRCLQNDGGILFPAIMLMFAGIDLLAKFYAGTDKGSVGARFKAFINKYFSGISSGDAEVLYQLRNALLHSFALYSRDDKNKKEYSFAIGPASQLVKEYQGNYYINPGILYEQFENALQQYQKDLSSDAALRAKFQAMFPNYGTTGISLTG